MFYSTSSESHRLLPPKPLNRFSPRLQNSNVLLETSFFTYEHFPHHSLKNQQAHYGEINLDLLSQISVNPQFYNRTLLDHSNLNLNLPALPNLFLTNDALLESYSYLRTRSFINFFMENLVDVPICFKKSKSLMFQTLTLPVTKFINFLTKKGKKELCTRKVLNAFFLFYQKQKSQMHTEFTLVKNWLVFFRVFYLSHWEFFTDAWSPDSEITKSITPYRGFLFPDHVSPSLGLWGLSTNEFLVNNNFRIKNILAAQLTKILPIFTFYIYNVDKNIKKYSRGKSGKYIFIWKYVPAYKRSKTNVKMIAKQIKFYQHKTFLLRLLDNFHYLYDNQHNTFVVKKKNFSYNYVFKHFRHSLMRTYLTTCI